MRRQVEMHRDVLALARVGGKFVPRVRRDEKQAAGRERHRVAAGETQLSAAGEDEYEFVVQDEPFGNVQRPGLAVGDADDRAQFLQWQRVDPARGQPAGGRTASADDYLGRRGTGVAAGLMAFDPARRGTNPTTRPPRGGDRRRWDDCNAT